MSFTESFLEVYDKQYKVLVLVSLFILMISCAVLGYQWYTTGELVQRGVSLKGGISLTIPVDKEISIAGLQSVLSSQFSKADISVRGLTEAGSLRAVLIEASDVEENELLSGLKKQGFVLEKGSYSIEIVGSSLGDDFFRQMVFAVFFAFLLMSCVVYATFRIPLPSLFVVFAGFSEIVSTLAVVSLLGVKLSVAGVAAFLMLIGYSVDSNIVLTTKVYKRREGRTFLECLRGALRTGMTMTATAFVSIFVAYIISDSDVVKQIMLILLIGLVFDIVYTWVQNAGVLRWYVGRGEGKR